MRQGRLFVISGPSGAGKGTICNVLKKDESFGLSVSMTTRRPRKGEEDGVNDYFVSMEEFRRTIEEDGFLEYAGIYDNFYGTPKKPVMEMLSKGQDVILEIEMQGASNVKRAYPEAVLIFVLPPSLAVLRKRLRRRGTETEEQLALRTQTSLAEIERLPEYDYYVYNDDVDTAVAEVYAIVRGCGEANRVGERAPSIIQRYKEENDAFISGGRRTQD